MIFIVQLIFQNLNEQYGTVTGTCTGTVRNLYLAAKYFSRSQYSTVPYRTGPVTGMLLLFSKRGKEELMTKFNIDPSLYHFFTYTLHYIVHKGKLAVLQL